MLIEAGQAKYKNTPIKVKLTQQQLAVTVLTREIPDAFHTSIQEIFVSPFYCPTCRRNNTQCFSIHDGKFPQKRDKLSD